MANLENLILRDTAANRPAAGIAGRLFYDTTNAKLQRDNGTSWDDCEPGASGAAGYYGELLLRTVVAAGGQVNFDLSSIDAGYDVIKIFIQGSSEVAAATDSLVIAFNNDTTNANYYRAQVGQSNQSVSGSEAEDRYIGKLGGATAAINVSQSEITIINYAGSLQKSATCLTTMRSGATDIELRNWTLFWESTSAINRITITPDSGSDFAAGTLCVIVGYKNHL